MDPGDITVMLECKLLIFLKHCGHKKLIRHKTVIDALQSGVEYSLLSTVFESLNL